MKHLKKFNEHKISIFNGEWKKLLPNKLEIITSNGNFTLSKSDLMINGDLIQISYYQKTFNNPEDVIKDGEPDYLCFDLHLTKNETGMKILVDISYGDAMVSEFSIESPNKVKVIHYTGFSSKYDPKTKFSFSHKSLSDIIEFFNRFGDYKLSKNDFKFLDSDDNSYKFNGDSQDEEYLKNSLKDKKINFIKH